VSGRWFRIPPCLFLDLLSSDVFMIFWRLSKESDTRPTLALHYRMISSDRAAFAVLTPRAILPAASSASDTVFAVDASISSSDGSSHFDSIERCLISSQLRCPQTEIRSRPFDPRGMIVRLPLQVKLRLHMHPCAASLSRCVRLRRKRHEYKTI